MSPQPHDGLAARSNRRLRHVLRYTVIFSLGLTACGVVHDVATAPFHLFDHKAPSPTPAPAPPPPTQTPPQRSASPRPKASASPAAKPSSPEPNASPSPVKKTASAPKNEGAPSPSVSQRPPQSPVFPTAKPVPDKPGYVYSPSQPTKYVDVTGYASGSKVKDPYSGQIFIVP